MQRIRIELENCYGIGQLTCEFDFSNHPVHLVYAPNGFMKTSLARTLDDLGSSRPAIDQVFRERVSRRVVTDETGGEVRGDAIMVIHPFVNNFLSGGMSTLLVESVLREEYEAVLKGIEGKKRALLGALRLRSGLTGRTITPESELEAAFGVDDLLGALDVLRDAARSADAQLVGVSYQVLFNDRVAQFLRTPETLELLESYVAQYERLIAESPILSVDFNHTQAVALHKSLADSRFFDAAHWITLSEGAASSEIRTADAFRERVQVELDRVLADTELGERFDALDRRISANAELRDFREYLRRTPELIHQLSDLEGLRRRVWGAYLNEELGHLDGLMAEYSHGRDAIEGIVTRAREQSTEWAAVVEEFNRRFDVPFNLRIENQADVILKQAAPKLAFGFDDEEGRLENADVDDLMPVLSLGERRALYLLNILFDLRARQKAGGPHVVVVDDIADSFDYRNKYAILEYLRDLAESGDFRLVIMSHNFDFHRGAAGRLGVVRANRWLATRNRRVVALVQEKYLKNPIKSWVSEKASTEMYLASIAMIRNLAEYGNNEAVYEFLTQTLHIKSETKQLTLADVDCAFAEVVRGYRPPATPMRERRYWDVLFEAADVTAAQADHHIELEQKIVLSVATRLKAEDYMITRIADPKFVEAIKSNQTWELVRKFRQVAPDQEHAQKVLDRVQVMTPENIHINSFMYEPIIDLGVNAIRGLYRDVGNLDAT